MVLINRHQRPLIAVFIFATLPSLTFCQECVSVRQRAFHTPTGVPVIGVTVEATEETSGKILSEKTDSDGYYEFCLAQGIYEFQVHSDKSKSTTEQISVSGPKNTGRIQVIPGEFREIEEPAVSGGTQSNQGTTLITGPVIHPVILTVSTDPQGAVARINSYRCETPCTVGLFPGKAEIWLNYSGGGRLLEWHENIDVPEETIEPTWYVYRWKKPEKLSGWRCVPLVGEIYNLGRPKVVHVEGRVFLKAGQSKVPARIKSEHTGWITIGNGTQETPMATISEFPVDKKTFNVKWIPSNPKHDAWEPYSLGTYSESDTESVPIDWRETSIGLPGFLCPWWGPPQLDAKFKLIEINVGVRQRKP